MRDVDVLIIGAGPVGLVMAAHLARHDVRFRLVDERAVRVAHDLAYDARTAEILDDLELPLGEIGDTAEERLLADLAARGGRVEWATRVVGIEQDRTGACAKLALPDGERELAACSYVVGCDRALRELLGPAAKYRAGRIFLTACDDSTAGIADVTNLAWKIASVLRGADPTLLDSYDEERRPIAGLFSRIVDRLRHHDNVAVRTIALDPDLAFRNGPVAGQLCPDLVLDGGTLHDLVGGPVFHLLAFGAVDEHELDVIERRFAHTTVVHHFPHARSALREDAALAELFGVTTDAIYVIRPDGYIGMRSYGASTAPAIEYLDAVSSRPITRPSTTAPARRFASFR